MSKRKAWMLIRVTDEEKEIIKKAAKIMRYKTPSRFIRESVVKRSKKILEVDE